VFDGEPGPMYWTRGTPPPEKKNGKGSLRGYAKSNGTGYHMINTAAKAAFHRTSEKDLRWTGHQQDLSEKKRRADRG